MGEVGPVEIRRITAETLAADLKVLQSGNLRLPENIAEDLPAEIHGGEVDFWLAVSPRTRQFIGRIGVTWSAPRMVDLRRFFEGLGIIPIGNDIPDVAFAEVLKPLRGYGIGSNLFRVVHNEAVRLGNDRIYLTVGTENEGAQRLYRRFGYNPTGFMVRNTVTRFSPRGTPIREARDSEVYVKDLP